MPRLNRLGYIDGLRAIAVLSVVVSHATLFSTLSTATLAAYLLQNTPHGVDLFFVISGFCLSHPTLLRLAASDRVDFDVARFAVHRIARILPPFWIAIVVLALGYEVTGTHLDASRVVFQALFLDGKGWYLARAFWTLSIEARWYVAFPFLLFVWVKSPKAFPIIAVAALFCTAFTRLSSIDAMMLPAFMLGIVAAQLTVNQHPIGRYALVATIGLTLASIFTMPGTDLNNRYSLLWILTAFALVVCADRVDWVKGFLSNGVLRATGIASYSIYLIHVPLMEFLQARGVSPAVSAVCGVAAGFAFWFFAERPFTGGPIRERLFSWLGAAVPPVLSRLGIPQGFILSPGAARTMSDGAVAEQP